MAIQLPDDLVVADGRVEVRNIGPEANRRLAPVERDRDASRPCRRARSTQLAISEQIVAAREDAIGSCRRVGCGVRPPCAALRARISADAGDPAQSGWIASEAGDGVRLNRRPQSVTLIARELRLEHAFGEDVVDSPRDSIAARARGWPCAAPQYAAAGEPATRARCVTCGAGG